MIPCDELPGASQPETVEVELLGVARLIAKRETLTIAVDEPLRLAGLLARLSQVSPALVGTVLTEEGELLCGHALSRNGVELLRDPDEEIRSGDRLLLFSTTAGG